MLGRGGVNNYSASLLETDCSRQDIHFILFDIRPQSIKFFDTIFQPFWPTGTGCARGFLGVFDSCWTLRNWATQHKSIYTLIAEREALYKLLPQTTPENLNKEWKKYTVEPASRSAFLLCCIFIHFFSFIFSCGEATTLVETNFLSFFLLLLNHLSKKGQNSPNKHGSICSLSYRFQI